MPAGSQLPLPPGRDRNLTPRREPQGFSTAVPVIPVLPTAYSAAPALPGREAAGLNLARAAIALPEARTASFDAHRLRGRSPSLSPTTLGSSISPQLLYSAPGC